MNESDALAWVSPHTNREITTLTKNKNLPKVETTGPQIPYSSALRVLRKIIQIVNHKITNTIIATSNKHIVQRISILISLQTLRRDFLQLTREEIQKVKLKVSRCSLNIRSPHTCKGSCDSGLDGKTDNSRQIQCGDSPELLTQYTDYPVNETEMSKSQINLTRIDGIAVYDADSESEERPRLKKPIKSLTTKSFNSELAGKMRILETTSTSYGEDFQANPAKRYCRSPQKVNTPSKRVKKPNVRFKHLGTKGTNSNPLFHFPPPPNSYYSFFLL